MIETSFTKLVGVSAPIQLAAMPGITTPDLVAAVADAGGLGMIGAALLSPPVLEAVHRAALGENPGRLRGQLPGPVSRSRVPLDRGAPRAGRRVLLGRTGRGADRARSRLRSAGELAGRVAGRGRSRRARGLRLHRRPGNRGGRSRPRRDQPAAAPISWFSSGSAFRWWLPAASRRLAAWRGVLACGGAAARMGTRFVAAAESGAHPAYVKALLDSSASDTCLTEAFSVMWPNAPHRVLRSAVEAAEALTEDVIGEMQLAERAIPVERFSVLPPTIGHHRAHRRDGALRRRVRRRRALGAARGRHHRGAGGWGGAAAPRGRPLRCPLARRPLGG